MNDKRIIINNVFLGTEINIIYELMTICHTLSFFSRDLVIGIRFAD